MNAKTDDPQQRYIAPIPRPYPDRQRRVGDNSAQMDYDINAAAREAELEMRERPDRANLGYPAMKRRR